MKYVPSSYRKTNSYKCAKHALWYMVLSSLGPWILGAIMNTLGAESIWYRLSIYFYLHFQYNGWMILGLLGVFIYVMERNEIEIPKVTFNSFIWLVNLLRFRRVRLLWMGPPCTSFSLAQHPKLRSSSQPGGLDFFHWEVLVGNLRATQTDLFGGIQMAVGNWLIKEQPGGGFMQHLDSWKYLEICGAWSKYFDCCRYNADYRTTSILLYYVGSAQWLEPVFLRCNHDKGSRRAGDYPRCCVHILTLQ